MPKLHIKQLTVGKNRYRVELSLHEDGLAPMAVTAKFKFQLTEQDQKDLRWYLEDYLEFPFEPNPKIAARVEQRMTAIGTELFKAVFHADSDALELWVLLKQKLNQTRVEISVEDVQEATSIPWELLRDPKTDMPLALQSQVFVRTHSNPTLRAQLPNMASKDEPIRILLVICRPHEKADVPFRSVASRLVKGLSKAERAFFQLEVLRPPTFGQLSNVLRAARDAGKPFHVVHFDGHGTYFGIDASVSTSSVTFGPSGLLLSPKRDDHKHGYLVFENPAIKENTQLVDGPALGQLLVETQVPVLVLNACRSAHAEIEDEAKLRGRHSQPEVGNDKQSGDAGQSKVRAFGSLAQEVIDAGVAGVVAMRYNVYVVTARAFVEQLYAALINGYSFGEAVSLGRKHLRANPLREVVTQPLPLQDWLVPVVYEAAEIKLFPAPVPQQGLRIVLGNKQKGAIDETLANLPARPDVGFIGRDETLLALDRSFDRDKVVLLHAYAGSGKTTTAVEFARWYQMTGGIKDGMVLFSSFETYKPLSQVLGDFGQVFAAMLEQSGVNWSAIDELEQRRDVALQVLQQVPVLWIWDNVEPVTGFPTGSESAWRNEEQRELVDFLRAAQDTQAKFLLTSRRDELAWLGNLPTRVKIPPMPHTERAQLAKALAEKYGRMTSNMGAWKPLLDFSQGNPLTITVLVGQALRDGLTSKEQVLAFVEKLQAGEKAFADEESEGRSKSLGASLSYGFDNAFTEDERKQLAVLHFFQGFVDVNTLRDMGNSKKDWSLLELQNLTRESGIKLLNRATEIGLLTEYGGGFYSIHPALPWYFKQLFDSYYAKKTQAATRAFVEAMGVLGNYYFWEDEDGNRDVIGILTAEEPNLLYARRLAKTYGWWHRIITTMQGLRVLYEQTGRRVEWADLVEEIMPDFVDTVTDKPLAGREKEWGFVTEYRVRLTMENRQWTDAERLQKLYVEWNKQNATPFLDKPSAGEGRNVIRTLAVSLELFGHIQREQEKVECTTTYKESLLFYQSIGDKSAEATLAFNLGHAYKDLSIIRNLEQAAHWYQQSLELRSENDRQGRGRCLGQLGSVAYERFNEAGTAHQSEKILLQHVNEAVKYYQGALDLLPDHAVNDLAVTHNALGVIYKNAGDLEQAMYHYREDIRYDEMAGNIYGAGVTRRNVAIALANANCLPDALEYARAALRNYQSYPQGAEEWIQGTEGLIEEILNRI
ncbi:CHAT domain-containing protein [Candidatus Parabeggiatoa sp. HSG14]|uniref:CHAT domain-containing protein n=1 Tax=Candidatus Parabeggiatoa sp. HSG14 TaxID=3055593 RepID=UPI0025A7FD02|nr:CHAT domain-containing protein [Thiotrichales bacterium HSG14]